MMQICFGRVAKYSNVSVYRFGSTAQSEVAAEARKITSVWNEFRTALKGSPHVTARPKGGAVEFTMEGQKDVIYDFYYYSRPSALSGGLITHTGLDRYKVENGRKEHDMTLYLAEEPDGLFSVQSYREGYSNNHTAKLSSAQYLAGSGFPNPAFPGKVKTFLSNLATRLDAHKPLND